MEERTYLRRRGRMTRGQARALEAAGDRIIAEPTTPDWPAVFGRQAPLGVEIGFGMGHALLDWAAECPDWNLVGIEVYQPGIGALLLGLESQGSTNVRVLQADARQALAQGFEPDSIDEVRILFPDPWPKKRHHKRRLLTTDFLRILSEKLQAQGRLHIATDWQEYADEIVTALDATPALENEAGRLAFSERPNWRPLTKYERRGLRLGHQVFDIAAIKR